MIPVPGEEEVEKEGGEGERERKVGNEQYSQVQGRERERGEWGIQTGAREVETQRAGVGDDERIFEKNRGTETERERWVKTTERERGRESQGGWASLSWNGSCGGSALFTRGKVCPNTGVFSYRTHLIPPVSLLHLFLSFGSLHSVDISPKSSVY